MLPRLGVLTLTAAAGLGVATALWATAATAQEAKVIKKGSGQYEEHYELLPPEEAEPDTSLSPDAGNLDPEGDTAPPASAMPARRAPAGSPKGAFGSPTLAPAAKPRPAPQPDVTGPEPERVEDATAPYEAEPEFGKTTPGKKPVTAKSQEVPADVPAAALAKRAATKPSAAAPAAEAAVIPTDELTETSFFLAALDQGGSWKKHPKHGDVFVPETGSDWRPYTAGRWIYSAELGWTWISDEAHGWATYHYGRWGFETGLGWFWVPGTEWAPSWVVWRQGEDAIGWAPLPPSAKFTSKGLSLEATAIENDAFERAWVFVSPRYFGQQIMRRFLRPVRWNADLVDRSVPMLGYQRKDGVVTNRGIAVEDVSRLAGTPPQRMTISVSPDVRFKQPSFRSSEEVKIYRPDAKQIAELTRKASKKRDTPAPARTAGSQKEPAPKPAGDAAAAPAARTGEPPKAEHSTAQGSATDSSSMPAAPAPAAAAVTEPTKTDQAFAPAPAVQRTQSEGALTETWAQKPPSPPSAAAAEPEKAISDTAPAVSVPVSPPEHSVRESTAAPKHDAKAQDATAAAAGPSSGTSPHETGSTSKPHADGSGSSGSPTTNPAPAH
jgi:hypothetical protein